jgi:hypothetical protein
MLAASFAALVLALYAQRRNESCSYVPQKDGSRGYVPAHHVSKSRHNGGTRRER